MGSIISSDYVAGSVFSGKNFASIIPGELTDTLVGLRWFKSPTDQPFFNPITDYTELDVLSEYEIETLKYNTAVYTYLPIAILFDASMFAFWCLLGFIHKTTV